MKKTAVAEWLGFLIIVMGIILYIAGDFGVRNIRDAGAASFYTGAFICFLALVIEDSDEREEKGTSAGDVLSDIVQFLLLPLGFTVAILGFVLWNLYYIEYGSMIVGFVTVLIIADIMDRRQEREG